MGCENHGCGCGSAGKLGSVVDKLKALAQDFKNDPEGSAKSAGKKLREVIDHASDDIEDVSAVVVKHAQEKPKETLLAALGIGALIGLLVGRK